MTKDMGKMHLMALLLFTPINHMTLSWADESDERIDELGSFQRWQKLAQALEKAKFDGIFFADVPSVHDDYRGSTDDMVRYGVSWPAHDPLAAVGPMAAATSNLGFATTISVAGRQPFHVVRSISTLNYMSGGRVGWNVVTGHARAEHRALGLDTHMDHAERYKRAEEFMEICYQLWDGIPPDAVLADRVSGIFADPAKVQKVNYDGQYFRCHTTPSVLPAPGGRPVLFQAGSSSTGKEFSVRHADVMFSIQREQEAMGRIVNDLTEVGVSLGRSEPVRVMFGMQVILGGTEEEALKRRDQLIARIPLDAALARASGTLGIDFSQIDIDKPLSEWDTQASRGTMASVVAMFGNSNKTIRQVIASSGQAIGFPQVVGTPEQVADKLEMMWRNSGGHGFVLSPAVNPLDLVNFAEQVVPILQSRGVFREDYTSTTFRENILK